MDFSQSSISANNSGFGIQTNFLNKKPACLNFGMKTNTNNTAYYAKKGEPMYMKEMDADEDGVVSFDEFKDYCQANGISPKEMTKMVQMANSYRTMQAQGVNKKSDTKSQDQEVENEPVYAKRGDGRYDEAMDTNNDDKVSYKEYIEYCKEHAKPQEQKSDTKAETTENGEFKVTSSGKTARTYANAEADPPKSIIEDIG